ncbi:MAG: class I SAM-dependent methyltransferase [Flavobacteriaceae bacterium]|nr:class I SAM-dependent methyltransferase [Flavobacteriaceae bacterium]
MKDIFGKALLDYQLGKYSEDIITETSISDEDVLSIPYLFRSYQQMPPLEQKALDLAVGNVLDVGCGAGSHSLYLQEKGHDVMAIDSSEGAVNVAKMRGVENALHIELLQLASVRFDTILLLMNGTGIFQKVEKVEVYLQHLKSLLAPNGQILIDSSDLQYMYDSTEEGGIWVPGDRYYGELDYRITYSGEQSDWFPMLYLDEGLLGELCEEQGFKFELIARGDHYDYLARITDAERSPS